MRTLDDTLKIRISSCELERIEELVDRHPDVSTVSEWVRREIRSGRRIDERKLADEGL